MRLIASAIAYHDAIYNPKAADNEAQSAALWREDAANALVRTTDMGWVSDTIRATADHFGYLENSCPHEAARIWMLDLDLTPLGEEAEDFARNTALLRLEYAHLSDFAWSSGRARFLEGLQSRPLLFRTPTLARRFEAAARANIAAALEALRRA